MVRHDVIDNKCRCHVMSSSQNSPCTRSLATWTFAHNTSSFVLHLAGVNAELEPFKALWVIY